MELDFIVLVFVFSRRTERASTISCWATIYTPTVPGFVFMLFWWTVYAASISRWPAINTSVTYLLVFVFPMRTVHTSAKSGATTKSAFTHSNKFLLPSDSCMAGLVVKRKCGVDFVYLIEGCGEPEENKRCNTPHLNRYGVSGTQNVPRPWSKQEMSAVRCPLFMENCHIFN